MTPYTHLPEWAGYLAALLVPSPLVLLKGVRIVQALIPAIKTIIAVVVLFVVLAEDILGPGTGAEKKAKVIADLKIQLPALAKSLGIPDAIVTVMLNDAVLSIIIDILVAGANATGTFKKAAPVDPTQTPVS